MAHLTPVTLENIFTRMAIGGASQAEAWGHRGAGWPCQEHKSAPPLWSNPQTHGLRAAGWAETLNQTLWFLLRMMSWRNNETCAVSCVYTDFHHCIFSSSKQPSIPLHYTHVICTSPSHAWEHTPHVCALSHAIYACLCTPTQHITCKHANIHTHLI